MAISQKYYYLGIMSNGNSKKARKRSLHKLTLIVTFKEDIVFINGYPSLGNIPIAMEKVRKGMTKNWEKRTKIVKDSEDWKKNIMKFNL